MIQQFTEQVMNLKFKKNRIVLIPQRILTLLLYKYFDFDYGFATTESLL